MYFLDLFERHFIECSMQLYTCFLRLQKGNDLWTTMEKAKSSAWRERKRYVWEKLSVERGLLFHIDIGIRLDILIFQGRS